MLRDIYSVSRTILYLVVVLLIPDICQAYIETKNGYSDFLRAGHNVVLKKDTSTMVLYDDLSNDPSDEGPLLFFKSNFFVPIDSISINIPLSIDFKTHITTENTLANFLYANLKLKKLLEEYIDIQDRSIQLREDLKVSVWDPQRLFQQTEDVNSLYESRNRFVDALNRATDGSNVAISSNLPRLETNRARFIKKPFVQNRNLRPDLKTNFSRTTTGNISRVRAPNIGHRNEVDFEESEITFSNSLTDFSGKSGGDPFIFKILVKLGNIVPYLMTNKEEAAFYGIFLGLAFLFFSSIIKR